MSRPATRSKPGSLGRRIERLARAAVPFVISAALLAYLFDRIDVRLALDYLTLDVLARFALPLVLWSVVTLVIEAQCLHRVARANSQTLSRVVAARIKAACYLLGILNYALGAAGLTLLMRRRTGVGLGECAGMVFLISLFDMGSVLFWFAAGGSLLQAEQAGSTLGLRIGLVTMLIGAIVAGFVFLRAKRPMGPLDRIRELDVLRAPRTAPVGLLVELGLLRLAFVGSFVALTGALLWSFGLSVDPFRLAMNVGVMLVVSVLPIAAGGLGTGQVAFVELFSGVAPDAQLLAASILLTLGVLGTRAIVGLGFASEFTREALEAAREGDADDSSSGAS